MSEDHPIPEAVYTRRTIKVETYAVVIPQSRLRMLKRRRDTEVRRSLREARLGRWLLRRLDREGWQPVGAVAVREGEARRDWEMGTKSFLVEVRAVPSDSGLSPGTNVPEKYWTVDVLAVTHPGVTP